MSDHTSVSVPSDRTVSTVIQPLDDIVQGFPPLTRVVIQRVRNGYLVRIGRGQTEVYATVLEVFDRLRQVL